MIISNMLIKAATIIPVMIIDSGFAPHETIKHRVELLSHSSKPLHGTIVTSLIVEDTCQNVKVYVCPIEDNAHTFKVQDCLSMASKLNVEYINMSFNGGDDRHLRELSQIKNLSDKGVILVASSGNQGLDLDKSPRYPQSWAKDIHNFFLIGAYDVKSANIGHNVLKDFSGVVEWEGGYYHGTSFSAPRYVNKLLKSRCESL